MKKLKQYNKEEIKALVVKYNALANDKFQTDEASMLYNMREVYQHQNCILPWMLLGDNETKSGEKERLYLEWVTKETENKRSIGCIVRITDVPWEVETRSTSKHIRCNIVGLADLSEIGDKLLVDCSFPDSAKPNEIYPMKTEDILK